MAGGQCWHGRRTLTAVTALRRPDGQYAVEDVSFQLVSHVSGVVGGQLLGHRPQGQAPVPPAGGDRPAGRHQGLDRRLAELGPAGAGRAATGEDLAMASRAAIVACSCSWSRESFTMAISTAEVWRALAKTTFSRARRRLATLPVSTSSELGRMGA
jgi:hypothetical protein